ncbi:MAG: hypothetical protein QOJ89_947 [bacterium]
MPSQKLCDMLARPECGAGDPPAARGSTRCAAYPPTRLGLNRGNTSAWSSFGFLILALGRGGGRWLSWRARLSARWMAAVPGPGLVDVAGRRCRAAARGRGRGGQGAVLERGRCHDGQQDSQPGVLATNLCREPTTALAVLDVVRQQAAAQRAAAQNGELLADLAAVSLEVTG